MRGKKEKKKKIIIRKKVKSGFCWVFRKGI